ncbi:PEGA domain-containing protein [candidate division KSB1 bacterium]|nr:PEGA domain-containing protein [candidate division KSB1 bacterium]
MFVKSDDAPFWIDLEEDTYTFKAVSDSGYASSEQSIKISRNQSILLKHEILPVRLKIISDPEGADIYLNNEFQDKTPVKIQIRKTGRYTLKMDLYGYTPIEETIDYSDILYKSKKIKIGAEEISNPSSKEIPISRPLIGNPVTVTFALNEDAKIQIDGKSINTAWQKEITTRVTAGNHTITIQYKRGNRVRKIEQHLVKPENNAHYNLDQLYPDTN